MDTTWYEGFEGTPSDGSAGLTVLSLGAGVQSTTMILLAEHGIIDRPIEAIFADTQWEPEAVYRHLAWLRTQTSIPIHHVTGGNLRRDALEGKPEAWMPLHTFDKNGNKSMLKRQCTTNYKIRPIRRRIRELMKMYGAKTVNQQVGISTDEPLRKKPSGVRYLHNRFPLLELGMSRNDCKQWLEDHGYPEPAKSACIGCPYHDQGYWIDLRNDPASWQDAIDFDEQIRASNSRFADGMYVHAQRIPLRLIDAIDMDIDSGIPFLGECEGMCGL